MIFAFYFFAAASVFLGWKSLRNGVAYLEFFKREINKPESDFAPFVSIIAPCRGLDADLEANLNALFRQDFPSYEIVFVVGDERDEAASVIKKLINRRDDGEAQREGKSEKNLHLKNSASTGRLCGENLLSAKLLVAGATENESQKIHNLRRAVAEVSERSEVFVFVDSDTRPDKGWLQNLIAPLEDETVGAATGYRWFVSKRGNFASQLRAVWNASIASALGANAKNNFCWGGSTAIRRATFERLNIREKWRGALADDYALMRVLRENSLPIRFVPQCLTATIEDCNFRQMLEFTTRQMKITRVYAPHLWLASLVGSFLFAFTFWTGILILFFASGWHFLLTLALLLIIFALGAAKARLRLNAVRLVLKDYENQLNRTSITQTTLWTITPILFFYNNLAALLSRKIVWRGIGYEMISPTETRILKRKGG
jgi:cellulose synthase/poly-beta-1,6-N-acetylglucosamine synthase-like glycosyltransferase